jgi:hypothetical protein
VFQCVTSTRTAHITGGIRHRLIDGEAIMEPAEHSRCSIEKARVYHVTTDSSVLFRREDACYIKEGMAGLSVTVNKIVWIATMSAICQLVVAVIAASSSET